MGTQITSAGLTGEPLPLEERVCIALIKSAAKSEGELNRVFKQYELTNATYSILKILASHGYEGSSCGQIAEQLIAEVPDMTRLLDRLERLGYVKRERSKADRRMVRVTITEKGLQTVTALKEPVAEFYRNSLSHVAHDRLLALLSLLEEVIREREQAGASQESASGIDAEL